jgi:hypothetical protein
MCAVERVSVALDKEGGPTRRRRVLAARLAVAGGSLLLALVVAEIGFRVAHDAPWYERLVEEQTTFRPTRWKVGRITAPLRAPLTDKPKDPGTRRILFLGDSFTYGHGLAEPSKTFVGLVAERLNREQPCPQAREYEVFNGGMPGSLTEEWVILFEDAVDPFAPDLVVAVFFLRDAVTGITSVQQINRIRDGMRRLADESLLFRNSYTYRFFRERSELTKLSHRCLERIRAGYLGGPDQTLEWQRAQANLLQIKRQTLARGARFAIVIFPVLIELHERYPLAEVCDVVEAFCRDHDIPVLCLLPTFMHKDAPSLWISPLDQHPNEQGHVLAADAVYGFLNPLLCTASKSHDATGTSRLSPEDRTDQGTPP